MALFGKTKILLKRIYYRYLYKYLQNIGLHTNLILITGEDFFMSAKIGSIHPTVFNSKNGLFPFAETGYHQPEIEAFGNSHPALWSRTKAEFFVGNGR